MIKNTKILGLLLLSQSSLSLAGAMGPVAIPEYRFYGSLIAGTEFIRTGNNSQTLTLLPPFTNFYAADPSYEGSFLLGIGAGVEKNINPALALEVGAAGYFNTKVPATGYVYQLGSPDYANFIYHYNVDSNRVMATSKLLGTFMKQTIHPYVSGEVGVAFNRASQYVETPLIYQAVPITPFNNHTSTTFAWGVGAGIDLDLTGAYRIGLGYQFSDLGHASLGATPAAATLESIHQSHMYGQQIRLQLTALR